MRSRVRLAALGKCTFHPLHHPSDRSHQRARRTATLAAKDRAKVGQNCIGQVEYCLEWTKAKDADCEAPGEPPCSGQASQDVRNGVSAELHGTIRHQEVDRRIGVPDIQVRIQRTKRIWIIPDGPFHDACLSRQLNPTGDVATDAAFVIEQQDRLALLGCLQKSTFFMS